MKTMSVVICTLEENAERQKNIDLLVSDLRKQTFIPQEIIIIRGARPRTKAHNQGVNTAGGELILFLDDDIRLENVNTLEEIHKQFEQNSHLGIVGVQITSPKNSTYFQRLCSRQLLKAKNMVAHAALCIPKELYQQIGGENEVLQMNDDALLNFKVREAGFDIVTLPAEFIVYHPEPENVWGLLKKYFLQGQMQAQDYKAQPKMIYKTALNSSSNLAQSTVGRQILRNLGILIKAATTFKWLLLFSRLATAAGFTFGFLSFRKVDLVQGKVERIYANING